MSKEQAKPIPLPTPAQHAVWYAMRAVHDAAVRSLHEFDRKGRPAWVLAEVTPTEDSGAGGVPGMTYDPDTHQLVTPEGAQDSILYEGSWRALRTAQPEALMQEAYRWHEPSMDAWRPPPPTPNDVHPVFACGGPILCRPDPDAEGFARFGPVWLLFSTWKTQVTGASVFADEHRAELASEEPLDAAAEARWFKSLGNGNPMIALAALQVLARSMRVEGVEVREALSGQPMLRAVFAYLTLRDERGAQTPWFDAMRQGVVRAANAEELYEWALAAHMAVTMTYPMGSAPTTRQVFALVSAREEALGQSAQSHEGLQTLLKMGRQTSMPSPSAR